MKLIPKIIIWLTKIKEGKVATVSGNKPTHIYCHRDKEGRVVGLLFKNVDEEFAGMFIKGTDQSALDKFKEQLLGSGASPKIFITDCGLTRRH